MDQSLARSSKGRLIWMLIIVFSLPLVALIAWFNYAAVVLLDQRQRLNWRQKLPRSSRTLLITGASTPYGLDVARAFHKYGYRVIVAEANGKFLSSTARRSRAISSHFQLPQLSAVQDVSYIAKSLVGIIDSEHVSLWIDCSQDLTFEAILQARHALSRRPHVVSFAIDEISYDYFKSSSSFLDFLREHDLPAREMYKVKSRREIHNVLNTAQGKKQYLLKSPNTQEARPLARLPRRSLSQTYQEVSLVKISDASSLLLEETVDEKILFRAFAIALRGEISLFQVRRLGKLESFSLDESSALHQAFKACVSTIAEQLGDNFSCHLGVLFSLKESITRVGVVQQITIVDGTCRPDRKASYPRSQAARECLVRAYTGAGPVRATEDLKQHTRPMPGLSNLSATLNKDGRYTLPDCVTALFLEHDTVRFRGPFALSGFCTTAIALLLNMLFREEEWYDVRDPLPAFWEYTVKLCFDL